MVTIENNYLLDTTVFVDYFRQKPAARKIIFDTRAPSVVAGYSIVTEAELWAGIGKFRTEASHILILKPFNRYFVNVTIARRAGQLHFLIADSLKGIKGGTPSLIDCIIAATAEYHQLTVFTGNEKHFKHFTNYGISIKSYVI